MNSLFGNRAQGQVQKDLASSRLDCFLSVVYIFPSCIEMRDMDLLS